MAEHSRCQPGRPRPHGVSQDAVSGSPSLCAFQSAKSRGSRLRRRRPTSSAGCRSSSLLPGELAVGGEGADVEVDVAVDGVGVPALDQPLHQRDHLGDVAGRPRLVGGRQDAEDVVGAGARALVVVGPGPPRDAVRRRLREDLVVDVGDVADVGDVEPAGGQPAAQDVEGERGPHVADVRPALDGEPADVDGRLTRTQRREVADRAGGRVVEAEAHCGESTGVGPAEFRGHQRGRDGGPPLAPPGEPEPVGGGGRDADRRAERGRQRRLRLGPARARAAAWSRSAARTRCRPASRRRRARSRTCSRTATPRGAGPARVVGAEQARRCRPAPPRTAGRR